MDLEITFTNQISAIQQTLRDCNAECIRLRELFAKSIPELLQHKSDAATELLAKTQQIERLEQQLFQLRQRQAGITMDSPITQDVPALEAELPSVELSGNPLDTPVLEPLPIEAPIVIEQQPAIEAPVTTTQTSSQAVPQPQQAPTSQKAKPNAPATPREGLEDFIGGNILNKIGIGILIIGIGIFVKYAIDQDWIGSIGRVLIGLLSGSILIGVAHQLRKSYKAFSSVLLGGGIAVMYFSVGIAFHQYHLISQAAAFALMCGVTAAAVFFSIAYDRQEIAVLALLGAFATPFMVSTGQGNYVILFSYLIVVNLGMLILAWYKDWMFVRALGYGLTMLLFAGWVIKEFAMPLGTAPAGGMGFALAFFLIFFLTSLAYRIRKQEMADVFTYVSLLSNSMFFYGLSMLMIHKLSGSLYMGIFTAAMGLFHFMFIWPVRKLIKVHDHLQTLLVGMVMTFLTLAIPIQLSGHYITLFWIAEAILLFFLGQRTKLELLKTGSIIVSLLAVAMLGIDWAHVYSNGLTLDLPFLMNGTFLTSMLTATGMVALHVLRKRSAQNLTERAIAEIYQFLALPLFYFGAILELAKYFGSMNEGYAAIATMSFTAIYLTGMLIWARMGKSEAFAHTVAGLGVVTLVAWCIVQQAMMVPMRGWYFDGITAGEGFLQHIWAFLPMLPLLGLTFWHLLGRFKSEASTLNLIIWGFAVLALMTLSQELVHLMCLAGIDVSTTQKVGFPILWGLSGFAMIAVGMRSKLLPLRLGGLALFLLILLKLFLFDIRDVSPGGKIAAFISLGVLLLVISFMYQRLRKLLLDKDESVDANQRETDNEVEK